MAVSKVNNKRIKIVLQVLGAIALALFLIRLFSIPVPFITNKGITGEIHAPVLDITCAAFLIVAIALFYHESAIVILENIKITKIKISDVEVQLDMLHTELKKATPEADSEQQDEDDGKAQRNGLFAFYTKIQQDIDEALKLKFSGFLTECGSAADINQELKEDLNYNPERMVALLFAHNWAIRADFLVAFFSMRKISSQIETGTKDDGNVVLIKAIGIAMSLLAILNNKPKQAGDIADNS